MCKEAPDSYPSTHVLQRVAIKKMEHITKGQKLSNFREVAALALSDHPNVVKYFDCYLCKDEIWVRPASTTY
jgi:serine/threonine protein kinase